MLDQVKEFMTAADCTTGTFNVRQTALYIGLQLEEMAEKMMALSNAKIPMDTTLLFNFSKTLDAESQNFKEGYYDSDVKMAKREAMLDADVDLLWVTIGSMFSQGAEVQGACDEVAKANMAKFPYGVCMRDDNGKICKPTGWKAPNIKPFVYKG